MKEGCEESESGTSVLDVDRILRRRSLKMEFEGSSFIESSLRSPEGEVEVPP